MRNVLVDVDVAVALDFILFCLNGVRRLDSLLSCLRFRDHFLESCLPLVFSLLLCTQLYFYKFLHGGIMETTFSKIESVILMQLYHFVKYHRLTKVEVSCTYWQIS